MAEMGQELTLAVHQIDDRAVVHQIVAGPLDRSLAVVDAIGLGRRGNLLARARQADHARVKALNILDDQLRRAGPRIAGDDARMNLLPVAPEPVRALSHRLKLGRHERESGGWVKSE